MPLLSSLFFSSQMADSMRYKKCNSWASDCEVCVLAEEMRERREESEEAEAEKDRMSWWQGCIVYLIIYSDWRTFGW